MNLPRIQRPWVKPRSSAPHGNREKKTFNYQSREWKNDRALHLMANPLCVMCKAEGLLIGSTVSDHIIPIEQGGDPWDWSNRQALCSSHHNRKSGRERWKK